MLTYSRLGYRGNLGNQLFQIAALICLSKKHKQDYCIPEWKYSDYFDFKFNIGYRDEGFEEIKEEKFEFHEWEINKGDFDLDGWFQTEKYFNILLVKEVFKFKNDIRNEVLEKNKYLFNKEGIIISVRRGDFLFHPNYYQLDFDYYLKALINSFPNYKEKNIIFTSDDINYCKSLFGTFENVYFLDAHSPIEQLIIASHFKDFIISNSTFSWWLAWLGEKEDSKIIRPLRNFSDNYRKINCEEDFFPERWLIFDHKKYNYPNGFIFLRINGNLKFISCFIKNRLKKLYNVLKKKIKRII